MNLFVNLKETFKFLFLFFGENIAFLFRDIIIRDESFFGGENFMNFKSYFEQSLFLEGLLYPCGSNIAPKSDEDQDLSTGYKYQFSRFGVLDYKITRVNNYSIGLDIYGDMLLEVYKEYNHYWDNEVKKCTFFDQNKLFLMKDNLSFESIILNFNEDSLTIKTKVDVVRNVFGENYDSKTVRDGMFSDFLHSDGRKKFFFEECYQVLADRKRLLHYSVNSDFFELFELPDNWKMSDGIAHLTYPKVFDDVGYDELDKNLEEVLMIMNMARSGKDKREIKRVKRK